MTTCPRCEKETVVAGECVGCGIIIAKYQQREDHDQKGESPVSDESAAPVLEEIPKEEMVAAPVLLFQRFILWMAALRRRMIRMAERMEEKTGIDVIKLLSNAKKKTSSWTRDVLDRLATLAIYIGVACAFGVFLLSSMNVLWHVYLQTPLGQTFVVHFTEDYRLIARVLHINPLSLSFGLCLMAAQAGLAIAAASRLLFVSRMIYEGRGILIKYLFWPAVCAAVGAWVTGGAYGLTPEQRFGLILVPALIVCVPCFELAQRALPELNGWHVFKHSKKGLGRSWQLVNMFLKSGDRPR